MCYAPGGIARSFFLSLFFFLLLLSQVQMRVRLSISSLSLSLSLCVCVDLFFSCRICVCVSLLAPEFFFSSLVLFLSLLVHVLCSLSPYSIAHLCSKGTHTHLLAVVEVVNCEYVTM